MNGGVIVTDGSVDFSGGVNSVKVTTIASERNPNGLARNELSWLNNAGVRDGGIMPRFGYQPLAVVNDGTGLFQGKFLYNPLGADPYHIYSISGNILLVRDTGEVINLSVVFNLFNPPTVPIAFFCQAERFLIIQAGDDVTLPLFWDGAALRRSIGITTTTPVVGPGVNEIPAAGPMDYYMGRLWYGQGGVAMAGDIVGGASGTAAYEFTDSVLNVTECPLVFGGDGFRVPAQDGIIRGLAHSANIDAALGQGRLFMGTRKAIYAINVPVTRTEWIATTNNNQPLVTVVQINNGWVNDRGITPVNGDLFYQSLEPGIRSLIQSMRYFGQWGNKQISSNEQRILQYNDRALLRFCSGAYFDSRLYETALPYQTDQGVAHRALIPMDFIPISSFGQESRPNWEGMHEGVAYMQLSTGDFGGRERAFATIRATTGAIELWEMTNFLRVDKNRSNTEDNRITWIIEFPAFTWGDETVLKHLQGCEIWVDRLYGTTQFALEYRPDGQECWIPWHIWKECSPRSSAEVAQNPITYPETGCLQSYRATMSLPKPPSQCATATNRPSDQAYQFQPRLIIKGWCRVRGIYLHATVMGRKLYDKINC